MNADDDIMSIEDAAREAGIPIGMFMGQLVHSGLLLEHPDHLDPRCLMLRGVFSRDEIGWHIDYCNCVFIPGPHPDLHRVRD